VTVPALPAQLHGVSYHVNMARKKQIFDFKKEVRKLARERVGTVPSSKPITPKSERKKPKHKKPPTAEDETPLT
jgi:hypothetical protein